MKMEIKHFFEGNPAPPVVILQIRDLIIETKFDENFSWFAPFITMGWIGQKLVGMVVYGHYVSEEKSYPRFLHVLLDKSIRGKKASLKILKASENLMMAFGYTQSVLIQDHNLKRRELKRKLAVGIGYKHYARNENSEYFYKNLKPSRQKSLLNKEGGK